MKYKKPKVHYVYKTTCQFWIYDDKAVIQLYESVLLMVLGPFMIVTGISFSIFSIMFFSGFLIKFFLILTFLGIGFTFWNHEIEILVNDRKIISKSYFNRFCIYTHTITWNENSKLKFIIRENSYNHISGITLILRDSEEKKNTSIIEFSNEKFFFIFHKKFNNNFPSFKIDEWFI